ncbi:MAG: hypothetical protein DWQ07_04550 [Chloroflexi bacterium]|nr:MAG: hypothetical protein DWQ07_04550 [Chloroflexota bacterium]MBL1194700.1 hypothetical protein [Chloroflexota bacterium]
MSFGVLIPWLGFYWDDWPLAWFTQVLGPQGFVGYAPYRPFSGVLYAISTAIVGKMPFGWQLYGILWRWLAAVSLWWLLRLVWPKRERVALLTALLFLAYPGFSQQSIALIYSLYFLYYTFFLLSLAVMVWGLRSGQRRMLWTMLSLALAAGAMFSTEYFYGLELLRPLIIWIVLAGGGGDWREKSREVVRNWWPYLLLLVGVFAWRFSLASEETYAVTVFEVLAADPLGGAGGYVVTILTNAWEAVALAWARVFELNVLTKQGPLTKGLHWGVVVASAIAVTAFTYLRGTLGNNSKDENEGGSNDMLLLGIAALLVGGLSFWAAGLPLRLVYPWDRGFLPMAFGASLMAGWLLSLLGRWRWAQVGVGTLLVMAAISFHFQTGITYRQAWELQKDMFQQLVWRVPGLESNTVVLTAELENLVYYTDDSLTAPLNWIYAPDLASTEMPYMLNFVGPGWGGGLPELEPDNAIQQAYRQFIFRGSTSQALVMHYRKGQCLRVLDPLYDAHLPRLPEEIEGILTLSAPAEVVRAEGGAALPEQFGSELPKGWCYYFQQADLARQQGDWVQVAVLGDIAFELDESPNHASEYLPFIEGYAGVGEWQTALELAEKATEINPAVERMICDVWERQANGMPGGVLEKFECGG